jgi:hypothetical protein
MTATGKCYPYLRAIAEIRINSQPCKGINLTTWHTRPEGHHGWHMFTTRSKSRVGSKLNLVSSSTRMPRWTHRGWPKHYPIIHPWSEVRYRPTRWQTKLLSLQVPIKSRMRQYTTQTCSSGPDDRSLTDIGGATTLKLWILDQTTHPPSHSVFSPFPLIALPGLQLCHSFDHFTKPHRTSID